MKVSRKHYKKLGTGELSEHSRRKQAICVILDYATSQIKTFNFKQYVASSDETGLPLSRCQHG